MLRVTVMMFRDMVESVMLLNDEDWRMKMKNDKKWEGKKSQTEANILIK